MKYPMINKQPSRVINIPGLSGGMNLRDNLTGVRDNQMTDCVNMWHKDGILRTRPPFVTGEKRINTIGKIIGEEKPKTQFHNEIKVIYNGVDCICATNKRVITDENSNKNCNIEFEFQGINQTFVMPKISGISGGEEISYFCVEMCGTLYCYISDFSIWKLEYSKAVNQDEDLPSWQKVPIEERYVPTAYIHCQRTGWDDFKGTFFEGYNLIGNSYKMIYSAYNIADGDKSHPMRYTLGQELADSGCISVEMTSYDSEHDKQVTVTHKIDYTAEEGKAVKGGEILIEKFAEGTLPEDGLYLFIKYNYVGFLIETKQPYFVGLLDNDEKVKKYGCVEDNVVITAQYNTKKENLEKVFRMTRGTWFGGSANGIHDGSRIFLCGNTGAENKSLVLWSGLSEPLYFNENCYAYVGSKSSAVTAFGKQGENLIIFKENKIYCTAYKQANGFEADDLIGQAVIDYEANSTYFPLIQINGFIGCDCPDTIQMCRNRLVWANTEGKVYTLCTLNQYNEHTVYDISEMVTPKLKEYKNRLRTATSADFDGHYILFLGDCALVADYCCYGYQYVYSYSKSEDANVLIPWYYWNFSFLNEDNTEDIYSGACVCMLDGVMLMRAYFNSCQENSSAFVSFAMKDKEYAGADFVLCDDFQSSLPQLRNSVIECRATTKLFEFGNGVYSITVDGVSLKTGSNDGADIVVKFITEQGKETVIIKENREFKSLTAVNFIKPKWVRPCMSAILKFGLELECNGQLYIDGLSVRYRILGGAK